MELIINANLQHDEPTQPHISTSLLNLYHICHHFRFSILLASSFANDAKFSDSPWSSSEFLLSFWYFKRKQNLIRLIQPTFCPAQLAKYRKIQHWALEGNENPISINSRSTVQLRITSQKRKHRKKNYTEFRMLIMHRKMFKVHFLYM